MLFTLRGVGGLELRLEPITKDEGFYFREKSFKLGSHTLVASHIFLSILFSHVSLLRSTATTARPVASSKHQVSLVYVPRAHR
jgi:hypothetical protein